MSVADEFENDSPLEEHWWKPGDLIQWTHPSGITVVRRIVDVRPTGYGWEYPDRPSGERNYFWSENSTDPGLYGWVQVSVEP